MLFEGPTAAHGLARELELHRMAEASGAEFVCLWQAQPLAVVLGPSCKLESEVLKAACEADGVPVLRRDSGGGAVLLGQGCLNYTLILSCVRRPELRDVQESYRVILRAVVRAFGNCRCAPRRDRSNGGDEEVRGQLSETIEADGAASRNDLYDFDLEAVGLYLREPVRRPAHRQSRTHTEFLANVPLNRGFGVRLAEQFPKAQGVA